MNNLRSFTAIDWNAFSGAESFDSGLPPQYYERQGEIMIADKNSIMVYRENVVDPYDSDCLFLDLTGKTEEFILLFAMSLDMNQLESYGFQPL